MRIFTSLIFILCIFSIVSKTSANQPDEIFDEEEIVLATIEDSPTHFRIVRYKYYLYSKDKKFGPFQKTTVEMQGICQGVGVKSPGATDNIIGWTTADEELIPPYNHIISIGTRAYHRLDMQKLEYQFQYLGHLDMNGNYTSAEERPYGKSLSSNKKTIKLKVINESWDTYFKRVQQVVC